jgi:hypothetical protein
MILGQILPYDQKIEGLFQQAFLYATTPEQGEIQRNLETLQKIHGEGHTQFYRAVNESDLWEKFMSPLCKAINEAVEAAIPAGRSKNARIGEALRNVSPVLGRILEELSDETSRVALKQVYDVPGKEEQTIESLSKFLTESKDQIDNSIATNDRNCPEENPLRRAQMIAQRGRSPAVVPQITEQPGLFG